MYELPLAYWSLGIRAAQVLAEAQTVIAFRVMGMSGALRVSPSENTRMVLEKGPAFMRAYGDAATAAMRGKRLDEIAQAALRPIGKKTRANAARLGRRRR